MDYSLSELLDIDELRSLCETFSRLTGFVTAILDRDGTVLTATGWQEVCTRFHRRNPETAARCRESDLHLAERVQRGERYSLYRCRNGLYDVAVPISIDGQQVGRLYSGQFLFQAPDRDFFRRQAARYGFHEDSYLETVARIPIVSEERVRLVMDFLCGLAEMIGNKGLAIRNARQAKLVVENSPVILFRWRATDEWPVEFVSENVAQFGYTPRELLSGEVPFEHLILPDDLERVTREVREHCANGANQFRQEYRIVTRNGRVRWVDDRTLVERDGQGRIAFFQGVVIDITERKRLEKQLLLTQFAFDHNSDACFWIDARGAFTSVNDAACRSLGYSREELLTMTVADIDPDWQGDADTLAAKHRKLKDSGRALIRSRHRTKDGHIFPVEICNNFVEFEGEEFNCTFVRDIRERKNMEEELVKAQKLESVGLLAGGIAHDFNNILTCILGSASLAKALLPCDHRAYRHVASLEAASLRARELTRQFLAFSKGGAPVRKRVAVAELLRDALRLSMSGLKSGYELSLTDGLWPVEVDEGQISQVLHNLMRNADQAMPLGGNVRVACDNLVLDGTDPIPLPAGRYVRISVTDQGGGIPEANLGKIFDPYFTTREEGRGLGLASAYAIMKNHGGYISAQSPAGSGATFLLHIPACPDAPEAEQESQPTRKGAILVMDDEELVTMVAGEMLAHLGYRVAFAREGEQALGMYRDALSSDDPFDAVIMDLTIPGGMGGKEAVQILMEIDPGARAIVSSGYSNDPVMSEFRQYGFSGVVLKPYRLETLREELDRVLLGRK